MVAFGVKMLYIPLQNRTVSLDDTASIAITVFFIVLCSNAVNFVDGLDGLAAVGVHSQDDKDARVLQGISIPPRRNMTVPASEEVVKNLGLKQGIRITAIDLSAM